MALKVSPEAIAIEEMLQAKSARDAEKYEHLREKAAERVLEEPSKKPAKNADWATKLEVMRETYPNAFRPWKTDDDESLKKHFLAKASIKQLSEALGRQPGSIRARLKKHYGDDYEAAR